MKRFLFAIIALITAANGWAETKYGLTAVTDEHSTLSFKVGDNENATSAAEGDKVIVTVGADYGWQISGITAEAATTWDQASARLRTTDAGSIPIVNITLEKVEGTTNQWTFTMPAFNVTVSATCKRLTITVKADDMSVTYGTVKPTFTATVTGFIDDDDESLLGGELTFACDYAKGANAGSTFTITPSGLTSEKYDIKFVAGTLTVDMASSSVIFKPWQFKKQFGDPDFAIYPSVSGGGTLTYTIDKPEIATVDAYSGLVSIKDIGNIRVTATLSGDDNYTGDSDWYEVEIVQRKQAFTIGPSGRTTLCCLAPLEFAEGEDENPKAYTVIGYDYDTKDLLLNRVYSVPAKTPLFIIGEEGDYEMICPTHSDAYYEYNMLVGNTSGKAIRIEETADPDGKPDDDPSDDLRNYYLKDGKFVEVEEYADINDSECYLQLPISEQREAPGKSLSIQMNADGKATLCSDVDLDFTDVEGLKAYVVTGYDTSNLKLWLSRVMKVSAKTPLLLKGEANKTYSVPSVAVKTSYENMLVGNTSGSQITIEETADGNLRNYYLKGDQFLKVNEYAYIANGKCYLQLPIQEEEEEPAEARMMEEFGFDTCENDEVMAIGIGEHGTLNIEHEKLNIGDFEPRYNLSGQRVSKDYKGMVITKGQKIITK